MGIIVLIFTNVVLNGVSQNSCDSTGGSVILEMVCNAVLENRSVNAGRFEFFIILIFVFTIVILVRITIVRESDIMENHFKRDIIKHIIDKRNVECNEQNDCN